MPASLAKDMCAIAARQNVTQDAFIRRAIVAELTRLGFLPGAEGKANLRNEAPAKIGRGLEAMAA
jgi:hypothetical protein